MISLLIKKKKNNISDWEPQTPESVWANIVKGVSKFIPKKEIAYYKRTTVGSITEIDMGITIFKRDLYIKFVRIGRDGHIIFGIH